MANKISTVRTYPLNGAVNFTITFEYLARKFVKVTLIGKDRKELVLNQDYRFTTKTQITTSRTWTAADGYQMIEIRRFTSATDRLVDFADGSVLRAYDLNISQIQTLHVAEEARDLTADTIGVNNDGHLDARGRRIVNLANAVDDSDAVPFGQLKTMGQNSWQARNESLQFRNEAETFRNQAEGFKNESSTNATNSKQWRDEANEFRNEAEQFKNTSGQYAASAGSYAGNAKDSEDEARRIAENIKAFGKIGYITRRSFEKGFNVTAWNEVLLWEQDGEYYRWDGALPKTVPAGSTPASTGGIGMGAWVSVGDASLRQDLAASGGVSLIAPGVMSRGADKFSIMQGRSGEHRQDTLTRGLSVELNETISGIGFAGATNTYMFNRLYIKDDKVDAVNDGTPGSKVDGLIVQHDFGGAGSRGGRHAAEFMLTQKGMTEADNTDRNYVGVVGYCATNTGDGGTSDTDKKGGYFGGNFFTTIKNAPFVGHANGCESNVLIDANSSVYYRAGYSAVSGGEKQATRYDAAYAVGALGVSGAQWKDGILMGVQNGRNPISRSMIRGESLSLSKIISFSGGIPADIITSDNDTRFNFRVDRLEMYYTNATLSLGSKTASNTPVINAYTDASGNRAGRIIFNGTATTADNGVCNIQFRQTTVRELAPSSAATHNCGTNSLPWAGGFTQSAFTVTSDERHKGKPLMLARGNLNPAVTSDAGMMESSYADKILDVWAEVDFVQFQYLDRVEEKGEDGARWHFGVVAQRAKEAFERHGLDAYRFGFLCYDEWGDSPAVIDEDTGDVTTPAIKAGSRYGIRYEEALVLEAALQRRNYDRMKAQYEVLVARVEALETK